MPITKATASSIAPAAKGDLVVGSATNDASVLAVGANDTVLTADSSTATGLKWAAASGGGMTLISTATPSAATTVSFTSIPTTYKALLLVWNNVFQSATQEWFGVRLNNDTSGKHWSHTTYSDDGSFTQNSTADETVFGLNKSESPIPGTPTSGGNQQRNANGQMWIFNSDQTSGQKKVHWSSSGFNTSASGPISGNGIYVGTSAISRIDFIRSSTQTITGTIRLYGVS